MGNDKEFKEAIGGFIIAFSELEFGLASLCSFTIFDLRKVDEYTLDCIGLPFEKKIKTIGDCINNEMKELNEEWELLKKELDIVNRERRFLVHGHMLYFIPVESITTYIKDKKELTVKDFSIKEITMLTNKIQEINTGKNGISGIFREKFIKNRIDNWNDLIRDEQKIIYSVNSKIISEWKGSPNINKTQSSPSNIKS